MPDLTAAELADLTRPLCEANARRAELAEARVRELEAALTPSAETKAAYHGEFHFVVNEGDEDRERLVTVPWATVKEIMAFIRAAALTPKEPRQ